MEQSDGLHLKTGVVGLQCLMDEFCEVSANLHTERRRAGTRLQMFEFS
jgi:hypothetical protein